MEFVVDSLAIKNHRIPHGRSPCMNIHPRDYEVNHQSTQPYSHVHLPPLANHQPCNPLSILFSNHLSMYPSGIVLKPRNSKIKNPCFLPERVQKSGENQDRETYKVQQSRQDNKVCPECHRNREKKVPGEDYPHVSRSKKMKGLNWTRNKEQEISQRLIERMSRNKLVGGVHVAPISLV